MTGDAMILINIIDLCVVTVCNIVVTSNSEVCFSLNTLSFL